VGIRPEGGTQAQCDGDSAASGDEDRAKPEPAQEPAGEGLDPMLPTKMGPTIRPASSGFQPKTSWNNNGSRKGAALMAMRKQEPPELVTRNVGILNSRRSRSGCALRHR